MSLMEVTFTLCCDEEVRIAYADARNEFIAVCKKCGTRYLFDSKISLIKTEDGSFGMIRLGTYLGE